MGVDNFVNFVSLFNRMGIPPNKNVDLEQVSRALVGHSKSTDFSASRGLVVELFPAIFEASQRMSARAISRYLLEKQNIKLSAVTITKALNEPRKSWLLYFESIEPAARVLEKSHRIPIKDFLFREKFLGKPFKSDKVNALARTVIGAELAEANSVLRSKWYNIAWGTRLKAQAYLEGRLI